ncbi:MAG TPA: YggS family pyridoxal phosphate-dependent enzyme [Gammaproteobacteria bacterium]|jgi:pyridoxal phosphate enzyme (YggS family)|nr:YggS family pyridoxal phosphate-dependent enzyme [Gammaproteobacteria bacterium]
MQPNLSRILKNLPPSVALLAVSKQQSIEAITELYQQGQRAFGENYLQEALIKMEALKHLNIEWHFIGHIQRNKTKKIAEHFAWVQSVDSELIAKRLNEARPTNLPPLNICLEVNVDNEPNKSGVALDAVLPLAKVCLSLPKLRLRGLMAIPKANTDPHHAFQTLRNIHDTLNTLGFSLDTLSMGMSADYELAIEAGSTMVRLGTALFQKPRA